MPVWSEVSMPVPLFSEWNSVLGSETTTCSWHQDRLYWHMCQSFYSLSSSLWLCCVCLPLCLIPILHCVLCF